MKPQLSRQRIRKVGPGPILYILVKFAKERSREIPGLIPKLYHVDLTLNNASKALRTELGGRTTSQVSG